MRTLFKIYNFLIKKLQYYTLTLLNYIIPKSDKTIFMFDKRFRKDNVWALTYYLSTNQKYRKYEIFYYTKADIPSKGNVTVISNPVYALWKQLRSNYIFYSYRDIKKFKPVREQVIVDTMHGSPLKKIGYLGGNSKFKKMWRFEKTFSHILCVSDYFKEIIKEAFGADESQCIVMGYPRNDLIFSKEDSLGKLDIKKDLYSKIVLWMPTYRARSRSGKKVDSKVDFPMLNLENVKSLNKFLAKEKILIIIKPHPNQVKLELLQRTYSNIKIYNNEELAAREVELYQILGKVDALLTDYSSVYFDFLLTMKPIGFVIDDIKYYGNRRGFTVENPLDMMPGEKIYNLDGLMSFLKDLGGDIDSFYEDRKRINNIANKFKDGNSCERIVEYLGIK